MQTFSCQLINACRRATTFEGGEQRAQKFHHEKAPHHSFASRRIHIGKGQVHLDVPHAIFALVVRLVKGHERLGLSLRLLARGAA